MPSSSNSNRPCASESALRPWSVCSDGPTTPAPAGRLRPSVATGPRSQPSCRGRRGSRSGLDDADHLDALDTGPGPAPATDLRLPGHEPPEVVDPDRDLRAVLVDAEGPGREPVAVEPRGEGE